VVSLRILSGLDVHPLLFSLLKSAYKIFSNGRKREARSPGSESPGCRLPRLVDRVRNGVRARAAGISRNRLGPAASRSPSPYAPGRPPGPRSSRRLSRPNSLAHLAEHEANHLAAAGLGDEVASGSRPQVVTDPPLHNFRPVAAADLLFDGDDVADVPSRRADGYDLGL